MRGTNPPFLDSFVYVRYPEFVPDLLEIFEENPKALYF